MRRDDLTDLHVFLAVAEERSFTRAAIRLGLTQSTLSHAIRGFEERLGELRGKPAGTVRITTSTHAHETILWPALRRLLPEHPDVHVEVIIEHRLTDIVAERFDAGIRLGEAVERDMIAVRIGPEQRWLVVGAPSCLAGRPAPAVPQDLTAHRCINYRNSTAGDLYAWEFEKNGRALAVRVEGPLAVNDVFPALEAALEGLGLAYVPEDVAPAPLREGRLVPVLADWCPPAPGYHLYYPSRRHMAPAFALLVDALRYRASP